MSPMIGSVIVWLLCIQVMWLSSTSNCASASRYTLHAPLCIAHADFTGKQLRHRLPTAIQLCRHKKRSAGTKAALNTPTKGHRKTAPGPTLPVGRGSKHCLFCSRARRPRLVVC